MVPFTRGVRVRHRRYLAGIYVVVASAVCSAAVASPAPSPGASRAFHTQAPVQTPQTPAAAQPQATVAGYAGTDTCVMCHTDQETSLKGTPHGQATNPRSPAATHGCESCHGPGQAHVDDDAKGHIRKFGKMSPSEINQTCLTCHNRGEHAAWETSTHEQRGLSCTTCHSVHSPKSQVRQLVKATETEVCVGCHRLQVAKTERA